MRRVLTDEEMRVKWGERFKERRKEKYPTQAEFARAMQAEGHATVQQSVGRWENIGGRYGTEHPAFPSFPAMQAISKLLDVQIGYLIGETDAETFDAESAAEYLGLDVNATSRLHELGHKQSQDMKHFYHREEITYAKTLNRVLASEHFIRLIKHLNELDRKIYEFEERNSDNGWVSNALFKQKLFCQRNGLSEESHPERFDDGWLLDEFGDPVYYIDACMEFDNEILKMRDETRVLRYLLADDLAALVHDLLPQVSDYDSGVAVIDGITYDASQNDPEIEREVIVIENARRPASQ